VDSTEYSDFSNFYGKQSTTVIHRLMHVCGTIVGVAV